jgi:drug/metabolite transporter (DMT)-like permease
VISESIVIQNIYYAIIPILYAGIFSAGIAFTLQIIAQRNAHPSNAAIIMSLEAVFAVIGGWLILNESISVRGLVGCAFMLTGMILSQIKFNVKTENNS